MPTQLQIPTTLVLPSSYKHQHGLFRELHKLHQNDKFGNPERPVDFMTFCTALALGTRTDFLFDLISIDGGGGAPWIALNPQLETSLRLHEPDHVLLTCPHRMPEESTQSLNHQAFGLDYPEDTFWTAGIDPNFREEQEEALIIINCIDFRFFAHSIQLLHHLLVKGVWCKENHVLRQYSLPVLACALANPTDSNFTHSRIQVAGGGGAPFEVLEPQIDIAKAEYSNKKGHRVVYIGHQDCGRKKTMDDVARNAQKHKKRYPDDKVLMVEFRLSDTPNKNLWNIHDPFGHFPQLA